METAVYRITQKNPLVPEMETLGEIIKRGGLVAFPTETVYGLGGNAFCKRYSGGGGKTG